MLARIQSYGLSGIDGFPVCVETDLANGLPSFETVGLPDAAVKESKERVRSAIRNSGAALPPARVTVNLAPADTKKEGPLYDLPIAVGLLAAGKLLTAPEETVFLGELSLNGDLRPVRGILPMLISARQHGFKRFVIPPGNAPEAMCMEGITVFAPANLQQVIRFLKKELELAPVPYRSWEEIRSCAHPAGDFAFIKGQKGAKRAAEIAAAGGHNLLMLGPPGSGKTMIARAIPSILPEMTFEEALEVTKIHSVAGILEEGIVSMRPFRAPHHTASVAALSGGGQKAKPGEVSLAHNGVLFLDELPEYSRVTLEALRQPLEDGVITVSRVFGTVAYPAQFMLVASMNPCPCGNYGSTVKPCTCSPQQIHKYLSRISGPLLDRIDLQIEVEAVPYEALHAAPLPEESSAVIRQRVQQARRVQQERFSGSHCHCNAQMDSSMIGKFCVLSPAGEALLQRAFTSMNMSARGHNRILKVARTIADLDGAGKITEKHIAEAIRYRNLDRKYWS